MPHIAGMLLKLTPLLLAIGYALLMLRFSVWQTKRMLDANSKPLTGDPLNQVAERMAEALGVDRIPIHIYEIDAVNGLASPDGRIFLTRGFLAARARGAVTDDELASVIAHELGHVAHGHIRRRMIDFTGQNTVFIMLSALLNRFLPFIGIWIANLISTALMARLSRRDEFEADAYASALLTKSGIGTAPQKSLFQKLEALTGARGAEIPVWLRSHPKTAERIAAIEALEARWGL